MYYEMLQARYGNVLEKQAAKVALNALKGQLGGASAAMGGVGAGIGHLGKALLTRGQRLAKVKGGRLMQGLNEAKNWGMNKKTKLENALSKYVDEMSLNNQLYGAGLKGLAKFSPARTALLGGGLLGTGVAAGVGADELTRYILENHPDILSNILGGADDATATLGNTPDAMN